VLHAQSPADDSDLVVMRTAGQSERLLKLVKLSKFEDGTSLAELKDTATNELFSIPGAVYQRLPRWKDQPQAVQPQALAKPKFNERMHPATEPPPVDEPPPQQLPPTVAASLRPEPQPATVLQRAIATVPASRAVVALPAYRGAETWRATTAPLTNRAAEDRWKPTQPARATEFRTEAPPQPISRLGSPIAESEPIHPEPSAPPAPVVRGQAPDEYSRIRSRIVVPQITEEREPITPVAYGVDRRRSVQAILQNETRNDIFELATALRPSQREYAASGLAACRFASRPEVKQVLAKAAISDPAPSVRAHCVLLLLRLGYHDPDYLDYLRSCEQSDHPMLRVAANFALASLAPKR